MYLFTAPFLGAVFLYLLYLFAPAGPRSTAAAVVAKNMPPAYFLYAATVLKEIIFVFIYSTLSWVLFFYLFAPAGPRSTAAAVVAKNMPPAYFLYAATVLKEIIFSIFTAPFLGCCFYFLIFIIT